MSTSIVFCCKHSLDRAVDFLVSFEDGQVSSRYPAPFSTYQQLRQQSQPERKAEPEPVAGPDSKREEKPATRKLTWKEQRELAELETQIETLEQQKLSWQAELNASGGDYMRLQHLAEQLHSLEAELEMKLTRWLELSELVG